MKFHECIKYILEHKDDDRRFMLATQGLYSACQCYAFNWNDDEMYMLRRDKGKWTAHKEFHGLLPRNIIEDEWFVFVLADQQVFPESPRYIKNEERKYSALIRPDLKHNGEYYIKQRRVEERIDLILKALGYE